MYCLPIPHSIPQLCLQGLGGIWTHYLLPCGYAFLRDAHSLTILLQVHPEQEKPEPTPLVELEELSGSELTVFITPPEEPPAPEGSESTPQYW